MIPEIGKKYQINPAFITEYHEILRLCGDVGFTREDFIVTNVVNKYDKYSGETILVFYENDRSLGIRPDGTYNYIIRKQNEQAREQVFLAVNSLVTNSCSHNRVKRVNIGFTSLKWVNICESCKKEISEG